jgi:hypothetical protein
MAPFYAGSRHGAGSGHYARDPTSVREWLERQAAGREGGYWGVSCSIHENVLSMIFGSNMPTRQCRMYPLHPLSGEGPEHHSSQAFLHSSGISSHPQRNGATTKKCEDSTWGTGQICILRHWLADSKYSAQFTVKNVVCFLNIFHWKNWWNFQCFFTPFQLSFKFFTSNRKSSVKKLWKFHHFFSEKCCLFFRHFSL